MRLRDALRKLSCYAKDGQEYSATQHICSWHGGIRYSLYLSDHNGVEGISTLYEESWEETFVQLDKEIEKRPELEKEV